MRVFLSADMEGATGVCHRDQLMPGGSGYEAARGWLTGDVNAAVEGAVAAGAEEVLVADGHGTMRNLLLDKLHPAARYLTGPAQARNRPLCQLGALEPDRFDAALLIGYHSRAGTPGGLLAHTWVGALVHEIRLQGAPAGEARLNAAILGDFDVPVVFAAGADDLVREARADLGEDLETVATKQALGPSAAVTLAPARARELIRAGVERALRAPPRLPLRLPPPVTIEVEYHRSDMAERGAELGGERRAARVLCYRASSAREAAELAWRGLAHALREESSFLR